jgi:hypothetical protein
MDILDTQPGLTLVTDVVARHEKEIQELKRLVTPMMEFKRREWVGLTDDEKAYSNTDYLRKNAEAWHGGVAWAEAKLKEKNGG